MAKYTETFAEYLNNGAELPAVFEDINGFTDLFIGHFCDKEIGFETEILFKIKLEAAAAIHIPFYKKKIEMFENALLKINNPEKEQIRVYESGVKNGSTTILPINSTNATPSQLSKADAYEDTETITNKGETPDEAIKRAEYINNIKNIIMECLKCFDNLFMKVY